MVRKWFVAFAAFFLVFAGMSAVATAETVTEGKMYETFKKRLSNEHYDYQVDSLKLAHVKTFNLSKPITVTEGEKKIKVTTVKAAVAKYQTVRDVFYIKDFEAHVFYAPNKDLVLKKSDVKDVEAIKQYMDQNPAHSSMEIGPIAAVMLLIIIVPVIFMFIWHKFKHSTMEYKMEHKLVDTYPSKR